MLWGRRESGRESEDDPEGDRFGFLFGLPFLEAPWVVPRVRPRCLLFGPPLDLVLCRRGTVPRSGSRAEISSTSFVESSEV